MIAKQNSSRLPGKNTLVYNGMPMYLYTLAKMHKLGVPIFLDSDSQEMLQAAKSLFPGISTSLRPQELRDNDLPSVPLFQSMVERFGLSNYNILNVQANSPSIQIHTIQNAVDVMSSTACTELLTVYSQTRKNNGSLWGFSSSRLMNYGDPYIHLPDVLLLDDSVDVHTKLDFDQSLVQERKFLKSL